MKAANICDLDTLVRLGEFGADPNIKDTMGRTANIYAITNCPVKQKEI